MLCLLVYDIVPPKWVVQCHFGGAIKDTGMDEDEELLYREMNPEDPYYMGDKEEEQTQDEHTSGNETVDDSNVQGCGCSAIVLVAIILSCCLMR